MIKKLLFFAKTEDLHDLMQSFEDDNKLLYTKFGAVHPDKFVVFNSYKDIPKLGFADGEQSAACTAYLIMAQGSRINYNMVNDGDSDKIYITQMDNLNSILFRPCGIFDEKTIISGELSTIYDNINSQNLMKRGKKSFVKNFEKIKSFYVGLEALNDLSKGHRLTMAIQSPPEYDLSLF